ncbi:uncharacterized protein RHOBADRAFT_52956 [Rhodotorula graminis WP1]|uniref:Zn(2)-C6 fungal-type domain-containing protein n=1 Tax=Rhodotorula graminis (strain WP1) TaxID=578459 RepID=A0A194S5E3_RHOGW|nr:uncharacterized protein RHOBADRAFT_52956 [Rhodotorula graminis WP1]KPV75948.1 hypothetical protein RHOBADRAFT_52956 [Rhodotorula graminis WP1]
MSYPPASSSTEPSPAAFNPPVAHQPPPRPPVPGSGPTPADNPLSSSGPFTSAPLITSGVNLGPRRPDYKGKRKASELTGGDGASNDGSPVEDDDDQDVPVEPQVENELEAAAAVLGGAAQAEAGAKKRRESDKEKKKVKVGARASIACKTCRKRKVRCSAEWPVCQFCHARNLECVYEGHPAENGGTMYAGPPGVTPGGNGAPLEVDLPSSDMILEALDAFITNHFDTFPFVHKPSLTQEVNEGRAPKEVVCCILALAARFSPSLRNLHPSSPTAASEHYAALASQLLLLPETSHGQSSNMPSADTPISLMRCQCHLMLGFYELTAGRDNSGWLKIGTAIRMAQTLRLGFDDEIPVYETARNPTSAASTSAAISSEPRDIVRAEMRRRTFWALFSLDRTVSDGNERPCGLKVPRIASLRMPGPDADFAAGRKSVGAKFDPDPPAWSVSVRTTASTSSTAARAGLDEGASPRPALAAAAAAAAMAVDPADEPDADLYGYTLRIAEIWSKVASYIGSGGRNVDRRAPWLAESTFAQLAGELADFEAKLPDVLKYSQQTLIAHCMVPEEAKLFALLHLTNAMARHVLHRDYLPFLPPNDFNAAHGPIDGEPLFGSVDEPSGWWQASFDMAAKSANTISDVCSHLASHGIVLTHPFAGFAAVAAGTVHSHIRYWPQSSSVHIDAAHYLAQDAEILNGLRQIYPIAARWYESLAGLQLLYFNLARGVLDSDPFKVRARVLQLLRSAKDDADIGSPVRGGGDGAAAGAHGAAAAGGRKGANGVSAAAGKGGARSATKASKGERGRPGNKRADSSSSSSVYPSVLHPSEPSPGHQHGLPHSLSGLVSPLDTPLGAGAASTSTSTSDAGPFAPLYAGAPTPTSAMFPPGHPLTSLDSAHSGPTAHQHHAHADSGPSPADLGLLPVPGDFSFDLSGAGGLGGLGGLGALSTLDEWGAGYYFGGSNWGLGGFGGLGVAPGAYGGPGPLHGAPYAGADLGWGGL